jgi:aldehyde dehydrogenase (NAD+)
VPPGVVNIVPGHGETAGAALASHPDVDKVAFTGSHLTGQKIIKASAGNLKRVSLELGGKSPYTVFADADLDAAVPGAGMAVFANAGQICSAGTRLFVERAIYDEFTARVAKYGRGLQVGDGLDPATQVGPLVSAEQLERVTGYLSIGRAEGARRSREAIASPTGRLPVVISCRPPSSRTYATRCGSRRRRSSAR